MASTSLALRAVSAASSAVSLASVPELVKKTLASFMPDSFAIFSASSTWLRIRYSVEVSAAVGVGDPAALAADDLDRLVVVDTDPVRDDRAMAGEKLRHGSQSSLFLWVGGTDTV